ncbi:MAG TPA: response regulator, partial [Alphaproteobacteria bacterium]|nr:response regulator [Alphaproteobacteria bacterium]
AATAGPADERVAPIDRTGLRVLMVEDDPVVARTVGAALQEIGYNVAIVPTADEAVPLLMSGARIDVLFTDIVTPGQRSGLDLLAEARLLRPGLPIVLTTGYSREVAADTGARLLPKPYRIADLLAALDAALAEVEPVSTEASA